MKYFKKACTFLLYFIIGLLTTQYFPYILALALNRTHGNGNNPDGEIFILFGIICLLFLIVINVFVVLFNVGIIKSNYLCSDKIIYATAWILGLSLGYINHSVITGRWDYLSGLFM